MSKYISHIKISTLLNITIAATFILTAILLIIMVNEEQRQQALLQPESKAKVMLDRNLATHTYFTRQLKPNVMELTEPILSWDYFDPSWMSSTYAVREMDKYFKGVSFQHKRDTLGKKARACYALSKDMSNSFDKSM